MPTPLLAHPADVAALGCKGMFRIVPAGIGGRVHGRSLADAHQNLVAGAKRRGRPVVVNGIGEPANLDSEFLACGLLAPLDWVRCHCCWIAQSPSDDRTENTVTTNSSGAESSSIVGDFKGDHLQDA